MTGATDGGWLVSLCCVSLDGVVFGRALFGGDVSFVDVVLDVDVSGLGTETFNVSRVECGIEQSMLAICRFLCLLSLLGRCVLRCKALLCSESCVSKCDKA
jgi:hypothetical protein